MGHLAELNQMNRNFDSELVLLTKMTEICFVYVYHAVGKEEHGRRAGNKGTNVGVFLFGLVLRLAYVQLM